MSTRSLNAIQQAVLKDCKQVLGFPRPTNYYWAFAASTAVVCLASYLSLFFFQSALLVVADMAVCYTLVTVLTISLGHQAFHGSLFKNNSLNRFVGLLTFIPLGIDGNLWRLRHIRDHHHRPNTQGHDADMDNPLFFRFAPYTELRWYHRFQHLYAPLVYSMGISVTVLWDDFRAAVRESRDYYKDRPTAMLSGFMLRKLIFFLIWFALPVCLNRAATPWTVFLGFIIASIPSAWIFLPIAAAHLNEHTHFFNDGADVEFARLQAETTVDFSSDSSIMTMIYGGLNCHLAHHLWPKVSCCHYATMYKVLEGLDVSGTLSPKSLTLSQLVLSHFRLLKRLGTLPEASYAISDSRRDALF